MHYPWQTLSTWQPFRLDALGLISLLGAEDIDTWAGRLVASRWVEYMPLLAMYVIAADRFRRKSPFFRLYNLSRGIHTTDCAAWFTRWMQCQRFRTTRSIVYWEIVRKPRSQLAERLSAACVAACALGFLLVMAILSSDFYGVVNVVAMIIAIVTRAYILSANRRAIDSATASFTPGSGNRDGTEKIIIVTPDSKVVTMFIPTSTVIPIFVRNPRPRSAALYRAARWTQWLAFGVHVVILGMASLATQIYTVSLVLGSSVLMCIGFGCADMAPPREVRVRDGDTRVYTCWIGSHLKATVFEWPTGLEFRRVEMGLGTVGDDGGEWAFWDPGCGRPDRLSTKRMDLYAWLDLTSDEETSLDKWDLLPHQRGENSSWMTEFKAKQSLVRERGLDMWTFKQSVSQAMERAAGEPKANADGVEHQSKVPKGDGDVLPFHSIRNGPVKSP
ncbi:uncharacterized protein BDV17DRAFT_160365 [Aspergillus undulatus]|uniref:uncharacterized protein n=1 Tax=Aspergillus undulatus TaxID=1810928 RepID=UPI003CCD77FD